MPAATPANRRPSRKAATMASRPARRGMTSHMWGAALPKSPKIVVKKAGNGFQEGPPPRPAGMLEDESSWPQSIQAHGSELGTQEMTRTLITASTKQTAQVTATGVSSLD